MWGSSCCLVAAQFLGASRSCCLWQQSVGSAAVLIQAHEGMWE